ncbi:HhH-GPD domain [Arabidopsis thaliana x Arabidopsis arenosa]|uniref:Adenine DNA glycosylase n=1 Tax=Arabidopsis thaliana x Arabidopsis arenosa TaxID=1240361 RepID=A0A8T1YBN0_9BRAS|nr:HhH-GPD domain [Arabidopsis thaliana x Arabidopsis arenosa]
MSQSSAPREKLMRKCREKKEAEREEAEEEPLGGDIEDLFSENETQKIRTGMLDWYDVNQRDLPWRKRRSESEKERRAYEVWVSEIMLQQTRVQTVMDYYKRWMHKWPTIYDLAQASLEEVNEMWAGLGYYRRARFLLEGAKMVVAGKDGFPNQASSLMKVKGIGEYTAGAIASIAFNEAVPVVDGNVIRVLARLKAISANPKDRLTARNFWKLAAQLVDPSRPGDFNQSLMELGATLCSVSKPSCSSCPVSSQCRAFSLSEENRTISVTDYPTKVIKAKPRRDFCCVCVLEILNLERNQSGGRFVLVKRPEQGLLAGLWEFPSVILDEEADSSTRRSAINLFLKEAFHVEPMKTCTVVSREELGEFVHVFTHIRRKLYVELLVVQLTGGTKDLFKGQAKDTLTWKCVGSDVLSTMGLTSAVRKVYSMVEAHKQGLSVAPVSSNRTAISRKRRIS